MQKRTEVPFYLPTLQWQKHLPAARLLLSNSALSSQLICSQSNLQNLHQLLHSMTTAQDLLLCKFHIFFRGCTMKSPMLAKLFFANNLYFPYTHPRHVFPWNAAFHYKSHTPLLSCSITTSPSSHKPHWRADGAGGWKHPVGAAWLEQAPMQSPSVHTRWQDQGHPKIWSLGAVTCQSATQDLDYFQGSYRSETWAAKWAKSWHSTAPFRFGHS